jgi:methylation protein EvaC
VRRYEDFQQAPPEYSLLFAWNHATEIFNKEADYRKANGKFIVYVPEVGVLS